MTNSIIFLFSMVRNRHDTIATWTVLESVCIIADVVEAANDKERTPFSTAISLSFGLLSSFQLE